MLKYFLICYAGVLLLSFSGSDYPPLEPSLPTNVDPVQVEKVTLEPNIPEPVHDDYSSKFYQSYPKRKSGLEYMLSMIKAVVNYFEIPTMGIYDAVVYGATLLFWFYGILSFLVWAYLNSDDHENSRFIHPDMSERRPRNSRSRKQSAVGYEFNYPEGAWDEVCHLPYDVRFDRKTVAERNEYFDRIRPILHFGLDGSIPLVDRPNLVRKIALHRTEMKTYRSTAIHTLVSSVLISDDVVIKGIEKLVARGVPVNQQEPEEWRTALFQAVLLNRQPVANRLLQLGADPDIANMYRVACQELCVRADLPKMREMIVQWREQKAKAADILQVSSAPTLEIAEIEEYQEAKEVIDAERVDDYTTRNERNAEDALAEQAVEAEEYDVYAHPMLDIVEIEVGTEVGKENEENEVDNTVKEKAVDDAGIVFEQLGLKRRKVMQDIRMN